MHGQHPVAAMFNSSTFFFFLRGRSPGYERTSQSNSQAHFALVRVRLKVKPWTPKTAIKCALRAKKEGTSWKWQIAHFLFVAENLMGIGSVPKTFVTSWIWLETGTVQSGFVWELTFFVLCTKKEKCFWLHQESQFTEFLQRPLLVFQPKWKVESQGTRFRVGLARLCVTSKRSCSVQLQNCPETWRYIHVLHDPRAWLKYDMLVLKCSFSNYQWSW